MWTTALGVWLVFTWWYTNTGGPLTEEETDRFISGYLEANRGREVSAANVARLRDFLMSDTGNQFVMVNILDMAENPPDVPGAQPGESSQSLLGRYMEFMYRALLSRACHPVYVGFAVAPALDLVGLPGAESWTQGALMRYRSRRDLVEIASNPIFAERHKFKLAALEKTVAFPVENQLYLSDLRFLLALLLFSICSLIDLWVWRR
ncbi:MAG: hypothetical protein QNI86_04045 [Halieaceae bacterium]|nr:hypothetical protein [Halieaceae bacterium]